MDEFNTITPTSSVVKIAACLEKIYKLISESREKKVPEHQIKEIEFLKTQCRADSIQLCLMSCQTFVRLVENKVLEASNVLPMLISLLPSASPSQYTTITEGIISLQLHNLKEKIAALKEDEDFKTPYGLRTQQHPIITLIQNPGVNMSDVANKISGICTHDDPQIQKNSVEYLRPVFLYILCNPNPLPDSKTIWTNLLSLSKSNQAAKQLIPEILSWSKISNASMCFFTSTLLIETIDYYLDQEKMDEVVDLSIYMALVINNLVKFGIDPRPSMQCLLTVLHATCDHTHHHYNVLLILLAECLHLLSPYYLAHLLRIISFIVMQENCGHKYCLNMCFDGIIQWMSQTAFIPTDGLALAGQLAEKIVTQTAEDALETRKVNTKQLQEWGHVRNFHPDIALAFDIAKLIESFDESEFKDVFTFVDALNIKANSMFCQRLHLFLRSLFLSKEPSMDCWFKIYQLLLDIIKINPSIAYDFVKTYVSKISHELNPEILVELLHGLPKFAVSKDNVPIILSTIRILNDDNQTLSMELYLQLWRVEPRTYPFLARIISQPNNENTKKWEYDIARMNTIREICNDRPTQYGPEMVPYLSETLNNSTDENGDIATSFALDAISVLCESHTISLTSTWRAISSHFRNERRPLSLRALYRFFAIVPLLETPTPEYEKLVDESLEYIWLAINSKDYKEEIVREALTALKNYDVGTLLTLRHIPAQYREDLKGKAREYTGPSGREIVDLRDELVPGECWVQILQKIRPDCGPAAADLIAHHISIEINGFRSGVYRLPEGKPEPRRLQGLYPQSALRAVTNYLVGQARFGDRISELLPVTFALRSISKKFPKPIPPMDWSIFQHFIKLSFDARKYCILIAKNQVLHSPTAKEFLEKFLLEFEPNCFEEDLLLLFSLLPEIANGVSLTILKNFAEKVANYCFKESQMGGFVEGCLFEHFLDSVKSIFTGKCDIPEVLDMFTLIAERYMDSMDLDSKVFERYTEVVSVLNENSINGLTSPANWWETPLGKLKKATIIRCYLVLYNTQLHNPLKWLTPIIDTFFTRPEEHTFLFRHLTATLYAFNNDDKACSWMLELFLQIQTLISESSNQENVNKAIYLLDILILSVDVLSGCAILLGNMEIIATEQPQRLEIFPESLQFLCEHVFWKDQETKIYEFLFNLYRSTALPDTYAQVLKEAIMCSRNKLYFDNKSIWTKYVGLRK